VKTYTSLFQEITATEKLFEAWFAFKKGKVNRIDVQEFARHVERNIFKLQRELISGSYRHGNYASFFIHDPKLRHIRKAYVRDRLVHQSLHTVLMRIYEPKFIHHVYSSRIGKGTHRAVDELRSMSLKASRNLTRECWSLKCDIKKFYDSVDHQVLIGILRKTIKDQKTLELIRNVINSFHVEGSLGKGAPIGNLTSQIFTNIYLNEFDQFVKHTFKVEHYLRFADDMIFLSHSKQELKSLIPKIEEFLSSSLKLQLHPHKIILRPLSQGIDFLGYVTLPKHRVLRTTTKRRMVGKLLEKHQELFANNISGESFNQTLQSYLGMLSHSDSHSLSDDIKNWFVIHRT
jgi:RNA-directed DNA polymerase